MKNITTGKAENSEISFKLNLNVKRQSCAQEYCKMNSAVM